MLGNPFFVVVILLGGIILAGTKGGVGRLNRILKIFFKEYFDCRQGPSPYDWFL